MKDNYIVGVIGAGNMGEALIKGLLRSNLVRSYEILASDASPGRVRLLEKTYGIHTTRKNHAVVNACDTVILAVKPQDMEGVCGGIRPLITKDHLFISIAAGIDFKRLRRYLGARPRLIRVMPNLPAVIDEGISAIYCGPRMPERYRRFAHQVFQAVGQTVDVREERLMDVVTGLSGTGPAYFFAMMEAMDAAGVKLGLTPAMSRMLTIQTAVGAAELASHNSRSPRELRAQVTSKKGTTWAAMKQMKRRNFWKTMEESVRAATKRARELRTLKP
ncbi:MAG: pyrroline-5-carboxylate reductase [Proteobacteria bacterium]|nr:pyrroline-5-carboxylate reductase [Pseudomonadota bacterium]